MSKGSNRRPEDRKAIDDNWGRTFGSGRTTEEETAINAATRAMLDCATFGTAVISNGVRIDPMSIYPEPVAQKPLGNVEALARRLGLWAVPGEYMGSSTLHNNMLLEFAEVIEKSKRYMKIHPVIAGTCGDCKHWGKSGFGIMAQCESILVRSLVSCPPPHNDMDPRFFTKRGFGCNRWEAK